MASFNKVILLGNLTRDPEVRYTPKGTAVTELGMAVNRVYTADNGEKREETTFVDVTLWGRTAEIAGEYLKKGRPVLIEGRLQLDSWDDKQSGQKRTKLKVVGEGLQLIGSRPGGGGGGGDEESSGAPRSAANPRRLRKQPLQNPTTTRFPFGLGCANSEGETPSSRAANSMTPTEACIALNMLPTMGPVRMRKLLEVFETPDRVLAARRDALRAVEGIGNDVADQIVRWEEIVDLPAELERIREFGANVITAESPLYPRQLREIHAPPIVLYVWGELTERDQHAIAVIGSRRTTHYGMESAKKLSYQLAYAGLTVISGLARGIDTAAHQGRARRQRTHDRRDRLRFVEALSTGKRRARRKNSER